MKERKEVARFIERQMEGDDVDIGEKTKHHYGYVELRQLMDFVYEGLPRNSSEQLTTVHPAVW